jgi:superfamily II RNA helicase
MESNSEYYTLLNSKFEGEFNSDPYDFGFELDDFQKHAITSIKKGENVLVTAHTGSGKTVPAIFGITDSLVKNKKIIYTSPIKSLSNQKLFELKQNFPDVGILTGDIKFNPDAQCVIMTTEILRNILYQKESTHVSIDEVDKVIFDEVHYINDTDRGRVWEECLILMPKDIVLIMLSATIDKAHEFASWVGNLKQKKTNLIPTSHRVVPLEHYFYNYESESITKIVDNKGSFHNYDIIKKEYKIITSSKIINKFCEFLKEKNYLPCLFFVFSRKECERLAKSLNKSFVDGETSCEIDRIFNYELRNYKKIYEKSPQYHDVYKLVMKGIAYHHSGLVPILKEVIEILFSKGLVKVLFATETFAVGVNMPTKTVIFPKLKKYSNNSFRYLRTDEYLQMAGRAGRRGLDKFGNVIILPIDEMMEKLPLKKMMIGKSPSIVSKFKLNYQFLLKIMLNKTHDLSKFMDCSLLNVDNKNNIKSLEMEKEILKDKYFHGLKDNELKLIKEYIKKEIMVKNMRQNAARKENIKLNKMKLDIKNFNKIYSKYNKYLENNKNIEKINKSIEYCNVFVNEDVNKMVKYLKDNNYICQETNKVLLKGIMASEISECNEIILTEVLNSTIFDDISKEEIVALISTFIEEKSNKVNFDDLNVPKRLKDKLDNISYIAKDFGDYEYNECRIDIETDWNLYLSFIGPAYDWACGKSIYEIYNNYENIYEGTFIRNILRINNIIETIKNICAMNNNSEMLKKLEDIEKMLIRDQVTTESLYIMK